MQARERATMQTFGPTTTGVREVGQAVLVTGPTTEEMAPGVTTQVRQEQIVMGETNQKVVEIPTVQEIVTVQEIPEVQVIEMMQEVPQIVQKPVEQFVRQLVEVVKVVPQERVSNRTVEQIVDVPVPMVQEEIV